MATEHPDPLDPATPPLDPVSGEELARDEVTVGGLYQQARRDAAHGHGVRPDWPWPTWTLHGTEGGT